jgi:hypothetical protein
LKDVIQKPPAAALKKSKIFVFNNFFIFLPDFLHFPVASPQSSAQLAPIVATASTGYIPVDIHRDKLIDRLID